MAAHEQDNQSLPDMLQPLLQPLSSHKEDFRKAATGLGAAACSCRAESTGGAGGCQAGPHAAGSGSGEFDGCDH